MQRCVAPQTCGTHRLPRGVTSPYLAAMWHPCRILKCSLLPSDSDHCLKTFAARVILSVAGPWTLRVSGRKLKPGDGIWILAECKSQLGSKAPLVSLVFAPSKMALWVSCSDCLRPLRIKPFCKSTFISLEFPLQVLELSKCSGLILCHSSFLRHCQRSSPDRTSYSCLQETPSS